MELKELVQIIFIYYIKIVGNKRKTFNFEVKYHQEDECFERISNSYLEQYPNYKQILMKRFMLHDDLITK
ncbi:unnamed protein product [Paramecium sonneborni]|uniref:Uncharacterized protein n=1 Tax=Paramecium sonneborni TaxID=65129 RepID=A0A8S1JZ62_9CILI|nr:unnamed protein product [Paramecium sonneborni]